MHSSISEMGCPKCFSLSFTRPNRHPSSPDKGIGRLQGQGDVMHTHHDSSRASSSSCFMICCCNSLRNQVISSSVPCSDAFSTSFLCQSIGKSGGKPIGGHLGAALVSPTMEIVTRATKNTSFIFNSSRDSFVLQSSTTRKG